MDAVNFSANGTRWRATPIAMGHVTKEHVPALPGTGVLFTSAEGEMRFLALDAEAVPSIEDLQSRPIVELGALVQRATPVQR